MSGLATVFVPIISMLGSFEAVLTATVLTGMLPLILGFVKAVQFNDANIFSSIEAVWRSTWPGSARISTSSLLILLASDSEFVVFPLCE